MGGKLASHDRDMIQTVNRFTDKSNTLNLIASTGLLFGLLNKYLYKGFKIDDDARSSKQFNHSPSSTPAHSTPNNNKKFEFSNTKGSVNKFKNNNLKDHQLSNGKSKSKSPDVTKAKLEKKIKK